MIRTINVLANAAGVFTSALPVNAYGRFNISIKVGLSFITDPTASTFSGDITLQRQFQDNSDPGASIWRDVQSWSVLAADALGGGVEAVRATREPEGANYRLGIKTGEYYAVGGCFLRLGGE